MIRTVFRQLIQDTFLSMLVLGSMLAIACLSPLFAQTPENFKIAFIGDQGLGPNARAVLNLIKSESAQAVVHLGDFDYQDNPAAWDAQINDILGTDFPYFSSMGNHDMSAWGGANGYQGYIKDRFTRLGIVWDGDLGVKSSFYYNGIFFLLVAPKDGGTGHDSYIAERLSSDHSIWRICGWHRNMRLMQVGGKSDDTGWGVYEESRKGGAIIATAHEHSYHRTHLLSSVQNQTVASRSDTLVLARDVPRTVEDEGRSFVFVSGLGGNSIRYQEIGGNWWAAIYAQPCLPGDPVCKPNANYGALFGIFNYKGNRNVAKFYFKDIKGVVPDSFIVVSTLQTNGLVTGTLSATPTYNSITLQAEFVGDENGNAAATLMHKASGDTIWTDDGLMQRGSTGFTATITGLKDDIQYEVKVTFSDSDGVIGSNPLTLVVRTLSTKTQAISLHERHTYNSITIWAVYGGDANSNGSALLEFKTSASASWSSFGQMARQDSAYVATIAGLVPDTPYDLRVTFSDPDGVTGTNPLLVFNIRTTAIATFAGVLSATASHSSITVEATYQDDGNNNGSALLEYKKLTQTEWISSGQMRKDTSRFIYSRTITQLEINTQYDVRVRFEDPDGVSGTNPLVLAGIPTLTTPMLLLHGGRITIDGETTDWIGPSPARADTGYIDGNVNEYVWRDATGDDLGDGGDAPQASDHPGPYTYPTGSSFRGNEADIEEFRIAYDEEQMYFLVDLVDSVSADWMSFVIILIDKDGPGKGNSRIDFGGYYKTYALIDGLQRKWDFQMICTRPGGDQRRALVDSDGDDLSQFVSISQNLSQNVYEVSVPLSVLGDPAGQVWHFAVLASLGEHGGGSGGKIRNVNYSASSTNGGGGLNGLTDSNIYDLIGASGANQYADLNNYTDVSLTVIKNSWVSVQFAPSSLVSTVPVEEQTLPQDFVLLQNFPNPFNAGTLISFSSQTVRPTHAALRIFNLKGQLVRTLLDREIDAGYHSVYWDGLNETGETVSSGAYFYQLKSRNFLSTRRMLYVR